jgi:hypothetical protein
MSNPRSIFPPDHRVFQGGRYLRAFDHAPDIDHYEHSILTYLGSLMPFDKGFVSHAAFPSIATISRSTKISEATVRKKLRSLQGKGYVNVEAVRFLNERGFFQQSSNNYFLSDLAFQFFEDVIGSHHYIGTIRKRAVGEAYSFSRDEPSPLSGAGGYYESRTDPLSETVPNSPQKIQNESPSEPSYSADRDIFSMKGEVDRIAAAWEELLNVPVSKGEKERFFREYVRSRGNEIHYSERILKIASDPYLTSRARSLNFLFSGLDCALRNRAEIVKKGSLALLESRTPEELIETISKIPSFIQRQSLEYGKPTEAIIQHLLQKPLEEAKRQHGLEGAQDVPRNEHELKTEIIRLMREEPREDRRSELKIILDALPRLNFSYCLELFQRFKEKFRTEGASK